MWGLVFLGWTSTKLGLMCLAQGENTVSLVRLESAASRFQVKHSTTALPSKCSRILITSSLPKRLRQTVQTQIRLLLLCSLIRVFCLRFWQAFVNFSPESNILGRVQILEHSGLQIFFKTGEPRWPMEQKMVGHFLKWWAFQTYHSWHLGSILYLHTDMHICDYVYWLLIIQ